MEPSTPRSTVMMMLTTRALSTVPTVPPTAHPARDTATTASTVPMETRGTAPTANLTMATPPIAMTMAQSTPSRATMDTETKDMVADTAAPSTLSERAPTDTKTTDTWEDMVTLRDTDKDMLADTTVDSKVATMVDMALMVDNSVDMEPTEPTEDMGDMEDMEVADTKYR